MAAYVIARLDARDTAWRAAYSPKTGELIGKYGGKVLAPFASKVERLEGDAKLPSHIVIVEFPTGEQAQAWYNDPEYAPLIKLRQASAEGELVLVTPS